MADTSKQEAGPELASRRWRPRHWLRIVLTIFFGTFILGVLASMVASLLSFPLLFQWIEQHLLWVGLIAIVLVVLTLVAWRKDRQETVSSQDVLPEARLLEQRKALLHLLRQEYNRRLNQSLQGMTLLELRFHERSDLTNSSAQQVFHRIDGNEEYALPFGTSIVQAYDKGDRLLLLGAPGAGKTTLLLELALELLARAESNPTQPIPLILNLASWATNKSSLMIWLVEQARLAYGVTPVLSQSLLKQDQWLLLLDGLDEVAVSARDACIEAINTYRADHFVPLVVCSRSHEYMTQKERLALSSALLVQPLEQKQVLAYLKQAGKSLASIRTVFRTNPTLLQLITSPLMLNVVMLTYRDRAVKDVPQRGSADEQQQQIFAYYVARMLTRHPSNERFQAQQTRHWLIWLARQMKQHDITDFYLENLQPTWLPTRRFQTLYTLFCILFFGLVGGLLGGLFVGLVGGLAGGLFFGLVGGLFFGVSFGVRKSIQPLEVLRWSWQNFFRGIVRRLGFVLFFVLFFGLVVVLFFGLVVGLFFGLVYGLLGGLVFGLSSGFLSKQVSQSMRALPNQGIRDTGSNALRVGLVYGLFGGLVGGLAGGLFFGPVVEQFGKQQVSGLFFGLVSGLSGGLRHGGAAYFKHYILRFILWRTDAMPWRYVRFLEEASERILLQRVGGGYRFIHPLFLDYFASLDTSTTPTQKE